VLILYQKYFCRVIRYQVIYLWTFRIRLSSLLQVLAFQFVSLKFGWARYIVWSLPTIYYQKPVTNPIPAKRIGHWSGFSPKRFTLITRTGWKKLIRMCSMAILWIWQLRENAKERNLHEGYYYQLGIKFLTLLRFPLVQQLKIHVSNSTSNYLVV